MRVGEGCRMGYEQTTVDSLYQMWTNAPVVRFTIWILGGWNQGRRKSLANPPRSMTLEMKLVRDLVEAKAGANTRATAIKDVELWRCTPAQCHWCYM